MKEKGLELDGGEPRRLETDNSRYQYLPRVAAYGADPEGTKYGFEDEVRFTPSISSILSKYLTPLQIDSCYFSGFGNKDVAWLHKPSKTVRIPQYPILPPT